MHQYLEFGRQDAIYNGGGIRTHYCPSITEELSKTEVSQMQAWVPCEGLREQDGF
jgi:hypothetical protein